MKETFVLLTSPCRVNKKCKSLPVEIVETAETRHKNSRVLYDLGGFRGEIFSGGGYAASCVSWSSRFRLQPRSCLPKVGWISGWELSLLT